MSPALLLIACLMSTAAPAQTPAASAPAAAFPEGCAPTAGTNGLRICSLSFFLQGTNPYEDRLTPSVAPHISPCYGYNPIFSYCGPKMDIVPAGGLDHGIPVHNAIFKWTQPKTGEWQQYSYCRRSDSEVLRIPDDLSGKTQRNWEPVRGGETFGYYLGIGAKDGGRIFLRVLITYSLVHDGDLATARMQGLCSAT